MKRSTKLYIWAWAFALIALVAASLIESAIVLASAIGTPAVAGMALFLIWSVRVSNREVIRTSITPER